MLSRILHNFRRSQAGSVSIEAAFMVPLMALLTGGAIECSYAFYQWNGSLQAARQGARLAATSNPVAADLRTMTGLGNGVSPGDPMPDYSRDCSGETQSCSGSAFDRDAMETIFYGADRDMSCEKTSRSRRGMCDVFDELKPDHVKITYAGSGLGRAGFPSDPAPLITVEVSGLEFDFVFLDLIAPDKFKKIPAVRASLMGEDLRQG